jgi:prolyl 4-hydroxylase
VQCVLSRSRSFLGTLLSATDDFGFPQLVRYETGERFDLHHDWYETPQRLRDGSGRYFNRIASFFVFLEDECEGGETWFPYIEEKVTSGVVNERKWRKHEEGGLAFRPASGSALFWINLHKNGTGDDRVMHAGLPLKGGRKTAMNIWPRRIY